MYWPACDQFVSWWDGEYEGNCELREDHPPDIHFDGMSWFDEWGEEIFLSEKDQEYIRCVYGAPCQSIQDEW